MGASITETDGDFRRRTTRGAVGPNRPRRVGPVGALGRLARPGDAATTRRERAETGPGPLRNATP
jgi:hypothetical protein